MIKHCYRRVWLETTGMPLTNDWGTAAYHLEQLATGRKIV
jgi:hypothetical protein